MKKMLSVVLTVSSFLIIGYVPAVSGEMNPNNPDGIYITEISDSKLHLVEFVELFNAGFEDVSLSGWVLEETRSNSNSASGGEMTTIPLTGKIPANGFVLVARNDDKSRFESYFRRTLPGNALYINSQNNLVINKPYQKFTLKNGSRIVDNREEVFLRNQRRIAVRTDFSQFSSSAFELQPSSIVNATPGRLTEKQLAILKFATEETREKPEPSRIPVVEPRAELLVAEPRVEPAVKPRVEPSMARDMNEAGGDYYASAYGETGQQLKAILNEIITEDHKPLTYSAVWNALKETDEDPNNSDNVILFYKQISHPKNSYGRGSDDWTREHVWEQSHGRFGTRRGPGTDLHQIKPSDATVNRARGSLDFDNGGSVVREAPLCKKDEDSWEPPDVVKGDIARMLFYMDVRYEGKDRDIDLELVNFTGTSGSPQFGKLSTLKQWHKDDPVSDFERARNEKVYKLQGNRNPFIDHPEWVEEIW